MPKVTRVGKFRAAAKASSPAAAPSKPIDADGAETKESLSRGQRKRLAKREQYQKRQNMVMSSLRLQRLEEQKGKLDGLDAIRESLPEFTSKSDVVEDEKNTPSVVVSNTNKSKKAIANTEISHMGLVLEHPAFKQNPFEAIQQHLKNTLANDAEKLKQDSIKAAKEQEVESSKKREEKRERLRDAKFSKSKIGRSKSNTSTRRKR